MADSRLCPAAPAPAAAWVAPCGAGRSQTVPESSVDGGNRRSAAAGSENNNGRSLTAGTDQLPAAAAAVSV